MALGKDMEMVVLGRISGIFGVRGWVKVYSHTDPKQGILDYATWFLQHGATWQQRRLIAGKAHGKGIIAHIQGCDDGDQAALLIGCDIAVRRDQLPALAADDFYWSDLEGLSVCTVDGRELGTVSHLFATGANDVLVVRGERERLIPYLWQQVVKSVDLQAGVMQVDWDPDF
jgi:16S rRNA processing protein RimM